MSDIDEIGSAFQAFAQIAQDAAVTAAEAMQALVENGPMLVQAWEEARGYTFEDEARAFQHARMQAVLTCPWLPPGPRDSFEHWLNAVVQPVGEIV